MPRKSKSVTLAPHEQPLLSLEEMLTNPDAFGLTTATNIQRAICRVADGEPLGDLWDDQLVKKAFGFALPTEKAPHIMCLLMAIRCAKSMISAAKAICATQNCDLTNVKPGDTVRIPVLSTEKDTAEAIFQHICGPLMTKPLLRQLVIGEPTANTITLRHPSGMPVEIMVTAMSRAGSTLVGVWLAGCIFDEAPRMHGDGNVKSLGESLRAIMGRILPGGQIWLPGSPHAPMGPVYEMQAEFFGKPSQDLVVVRARGPDVNPYYWTPERVEELKRRNPQAFRTDCEAEFADPEESLISSVELEAMTRSAPMILPRAPKVKYVAAIDPAFRGNSWTLHILGCYGRDELLRPKYKLALTRQWTGSKSAPLDVGQVLHEISVDLAAYGLDEAYTDQYSFDTLRELAEIKKVILRLVNIGADNRLKFAEQVSHLISTCRLEIPPDPVVRTDLLAARKRVTQAAASLVLPRSGDGRHCDHLPALMLAANHPPDPPDADNPPNPHGMFAGAMAKMARAEAESGWERVGKRLLGH